MCIQLGAEHERVNANSSEEANCEDAVDVVVGVLVHVTDTWQADAGDHADVVHEVVCARGGLHVVENLVVGSDVGLVDKHCEEDAQDAENAVIELQTDHITNHG